MTTVIHRIRMTSIIQITVGHSQDEKKANHERIVEIAAARIRESGTEAPGVAEIMQAAGLTHGGFYKHFGSRDELVAEAVERAFDDVDAANRGGARGRRRSAGGVRRLLPVRRAPRRRRRRLRRRRAGRRRPRADERVRARTASRSSATSRTSRSCSAAATMPRPRSSRSARSSARCWSRAPWTTPRSRTRSCATVRETVRSADDDVSRESCGAVVRAGSDRSPWGVPIDGQSDRPAVSAGHRNAPATRSRAAGLNIITPASRTRSTTPRRPSVYLFADANIKTAVLLGGPAGLETPADGYACKRTRPRPGRKAGRSPRRAP